jgi:hypothetical protein
VPRTEVSSQWTTEAPKLSATHKLARLFSSNTIDGTSVNALPLRFLQHSNNVRSCAKFNASPQSAASPYRVVSQEKEPSRVFNWLSPRSLAPRTRTQSPVSHGAKRGPLSQHVQSQEPVELKRSRRDLREDVVRQIPDSNPSETISLRAILQRTQLTGSRGTGS